MRSLVAILALILLAIVLGAIVAYVQRQISRRRRAELRADTLFDVAFDYAQTLRLIGDTSMDSDSSLLAQGVLEKHKTAYQQQLEGTNR